MKRKFKKVFSLLLALMMMATLGVTFFASATDVSNADSADVAVSAMNAGLAELKDTIHINNLITVVVAGIGAGIFFVFFWWGIRKLIRMVMTAFRKGKISV